MNLTVYAKTKKTAEGRTFRIYLSRITRKSTGEEVPVRINFKEGVPLPTVFPVNLIVEKEDANLTVKHYKNDEGEDCTAHNLWIEKYTMGEPFVDHSLDDYE